MLSLLEKDLEGNTDFYDNFCSAKGCCLIALKRSLAIILVLSVFFMRFLASPIFRLTLLTFRPQKRDKQVAPSGH